MLDRAEKYGKDFLLVGIPLAHSVLEMLTKVR